LHLRIFIPELSISIGICLNRLKTCTVSRFPRSFRAPETLRDCPSSRPVSRQSRLRLTAFPNVGIAPLHCKFPKQVPVQGTFGSQNKMGRGAMVKAKFHALIARSFANGFELMPAVEPQIPAMNSNQFEPPPWAGMYPTQGVLRHAIEPPPWAQMPADGFLPSLSGGRAAGQMNPCSEGMNDAMMIVSNRFAQFNSPAGECAPV